MENSVNTTEKRDSMDLINQLALDTESSTCPSGSQTYRVQRGDSFYLIARKFGVSVRTLMNANPTIAA